MHIVLIHGIEQFCPKCDIARDQFINLLIGMNRCIVCGKVKDDIRCSLPHNIPQIHTIRIVKRDLLLHIRRKEFYIR